METAILPFELKPADKLLAWKLYERMSPSLCNGELRYRSFEEFSDLVPHLTVVLLNTKLVGTFALIPWNDKVELSLLWISNDFRKLGLCTQLVGWAVKQAKVLGYSQIFACTTVTKMQSLFVDFGFKKVCPSEVPPEKWAGYPKDRCPQVFLLKL